MPPLSESTGSILSFLLYTIPQQLWVHILLRLPVLYFSRVARVFTDSGITIPDLRRLATVQAHNNLVSGAESIPLKDFKRSWTRFLSSLKAEWLAQGTVSALLLPYVASSAVIE
jgi:hypothetical protein